MGEPVFILAPGRCFSSLVCAMLGQNPQLYSVLETQLLTRDTMNEWLAAFAGGIHAHGLLRAVAEIIFGGQEERQIARARWWLAKRCDKNTDEVLKTLAAELSPLSLVEKSPMATAQGTCGALNDSFLALASSTWCGIRWAMVAHCWNSSASVPHGIICGV
jgi:hypothetical protein